MKTLCFNVYFKSSILLFIPNIVKHGLHVCLACDGRPEHDAGEAHVAGDGLADALLAALARAAVLVSPAGLHWHKQAIVRGVVIISVFQLKLCNKRCNQLNYLGRCSNSCLYNGLYAAWKDTRFAVAQCDHLSPSTQTLLRHRL